MSKQIKRISLLAVGIAMFVVMSLCLQVPVFENYYLCLGYVVMAVYCCSFGTLSGTVVGFFGVVRQNNHGFAREHFVLFLARHDFLIFVSVKILLFERKGFNLNFKLGGFERALFEFLLELPVARCCRNGIIGKNETEDDSTGGSNIVDRQKVLLREVTEATETGPQFIHKLIIPQRPALTAVLYGYP